jgi:hypothetical protein
MLSPKWFRTERRRAVSRRARAARYPAARGAPSRGASFSPHATCCLPPAPYVHAERTVGPSTVPRAGRDATVPWRHLRRHLVVTGEPAPYLRCHCLPADEHRAGQPPLPPSRQARPSTSTPSRPTTSHPSLSPAKAQALAHCLGNVAALPEYRPPRPPPPAAAARPRR